MLVIVVSSSRFGDYSRSLVAKMRYCGDGCIVVAPATVLFALNYCGSGGRI